MNPLGLNGSVQDDWDLQKEKRVPLPKGTYGTPQYTSMVATSIKADFYLTHCGRN